MIMEHLWDWALMNCLHLEIFPIVCWGEVCIQCDQIALLFSKFGHLERWKIAQKYKIFAKVGSQFWQILNSHSRIDQTLFKICLSGEISLNLVTLSAFAVFTSRQKVNMQFLNVRRQFFSGNWSDKTGQRWLLLLPKSM